VGTPLFSTKLLDGEINLEARVAGLSGPSDQLDTHPVSQIPIIVLSEPPRTRVLWSRTEAAGTALNVSVGTEVSSSDFDSGCAAVHYSLDGQPWKRVNGSQLRLQGLPVGPHQLWMRAESFAGNEDALPKVLTWSANGAVAGPTEQQSLYLVSGPDTGTSLAAFTVAGWSSGSFKWRLDGGAWTVANGSPKVMCKVGIGFHTWEALPAATVDSVWTDPPLFHKWMVVGKSAGDFLQLNELSEGPHRLSAKAADTAGESPLHVLHL
jgi:hypothetical protein